MGVVTSNGKLKDAIARLNRLANKLDDPSPLASSLAEALTYRLAANVPKGTADLDVDPGLLWKGLQYWIVRGSHASVGDPRILTSTSAPHGSISAFISYMLESGEGFIRRTQPEGNKKSRGEQTTRGLTQRRGMTPAQVRARRKERDAAHRLHRTSEVIANYKKRIAAYAITFGKTGVDKQGRRYEAMFARAKEELDAWKLGLSQYGITKSSTRAKLSYARQHAVAKEEVRRLYNKTTSPEVKKKYREAWKTLLKEDLIKERELARAGARQDRFNERIKKMRAKAERAAEREEWKMNIRARKKTAEERLAAKEKKRADRKLMQFKSALFKAYTKYPAVKRKFNNLNLNYKFVNTMRRTGVKLPSFKEWKKANKPKIEKPKTVKPKATRPKATKSKSPDVLVRKLVKLFDKSKAEYNRVKLNKKFTDYQRRLNRRGKN